MRAPKPGTKLHRLASSIALIWIGLLVGFGGPLAYQQVHDHYSLQGCAEGFLQADADRQIAFNHFPPSDNNNLEVLVQYAIDFETAFTDRVRALDCPSSVQDEQTELVFRDELLVRYLRTIIADPAQYDAFFLGIRTGEVARAREAMISAIAELVPKPETGASSPSS